MIAPTKCAFGDPCCPCQDGDVCHYVDDGDTKAMAPPRGDAWTFDENDPLVQAMRAKEARR